MLVNCFDLGKQCCSVSTISNILALATWLEWSTVMQEFRLRILVDPKQFPLGITSLVAPESASGSGSGLYLVVVNAQLSENKRGESVVTLPFLTFSLLG